MTVFADASALVKRYVDEDGAEAIRSLTTLAVSALSRVEVASGLWRKTVTEDVEPAAAYSLTAVFTADWTRGDFGVIACTPAVLEQAITLVSRYSLRAYDSVQLASAAAARSVDPEVRTFACFDRRLREAAVREGWDALPATL